MVSGLILPFALTVCSLGEEDTVFIFLIFKGKEGSLWPS